MNQVAATIHPTMQLTQRIRNLALAAAASVAILADPATQAHAASATDQPNLCSGRNVATGHIEFYLPGEKAEDVYGNKWFCGADGKWHRDYSSIFVPTPTPTRSSTLLAPLAGSTLLGR